MELYRSAQYEGVNSSEVSTSKGCLYKTLLEDFLADLALPNEPI